MKVLTFTSLYPDSTRPRHGIFIEKRVQELASVGEVEILVVAPCPWFPFQSPFFGKYSEYARVPCFEKHNGIPVYHPRYLLIPKIGMTVAPLFLYRAMIGSLRQIIATHGDFDLIDAHYFFPDGVAAVMLARHFRKPVMVTARGSDLNILPRYLGPRHWITWAASKADGLATVSAALRDRLVELGAQPSKVKVLRNGVDLKLFHPIERNCCRASLGLDVDRTILLSVGNLVPVKGHETTIATLTKLPTARLLFVGDGPDRAALGSLADRYGVADRVTFLGNRPQATLAELYSAADVLILASRHEGWPNVLLEAMACGTPVVVSDIPGMSEIVSPDVGRLFPSGNPEALAGAISAILQHPLDRRVVRKYAEGFSWRNTTSGQLALFHGILQRKSEAPRASW